MKKLFLIVIVLCCTGIAFGQTRDTEHYLRELDRIYDETDSLDVVNRSFMEQYVRATDPVRLAALDAAMKDGQRKRDSLSYEYALNFFAVYEYAQPYTHDDFLVDLLNLSADIYLREERFGKFREPARALYERLTEKDKISDFGKQIQIYLFSYRRVAVGDRLPDFTLPDLNGTIHRLSDHTGKYLLLDFWASWCGPCVAAIPELREVWESNKDILTVIGISLDDSKQEWAKAVEKHAVPWLDLNAPTGSEILGCFHVTTIPRQIIVSPDGIVIASWEGFKQGMVKSKLQESIPGLK